jgi:hypothetical protein
MPLDDTNRTTIAAPTDAVHPVLRDKAIVATIAEFARNKADSDRLDKRNEAIRPLIVAAMDGAAVVCAGTHIVRRTEVAGTPATPNVAITRAMIGQVIPGTKGRAGSVRLEVI